MVKKIVAYIGTRKGKNSNTYKLIELIRYKCLEKSEEIDMEILTANDFIINACIGCERCFVSGICPLDKTDDARILKEKILAADMIIFASPVYAHNVSGDMKTVIDRISYWFHNMKLNGKYAAVISTTASNGHLTVITYLEKMMQTFGARMLFKLNCAITDGDEYNNQEWINKKTNELSDKIISAFNTPIMSNSALETVFSMTKLRYEGMKNTGHVIENMKESEKIGLFKSKTYQEFLDIHYNERKQL